MGGVSHYVNTEGFLAPEIADMIESLSQRELHDPLHVKSNLTQALNLWRRSKLLPEEFLGLIRSARKITDERSGVIRKRNDGYMGLRNHAPYFFQVLKDLIGRNTLTKFRHQFIARKSFD